MARPLRVDFPGALHVVTARAVPRQKLFRSEEEVDDFAGRLPGLVEAFGARFHGYCLLPNHYHLLVETPGANLARVLHRLNAGYTATANARRSRKGSLLQSRYRAVVFDEDPWLVRLSLYLHLNPVRKGLAADPWVYRGSSARAFGPTPEAIPGLDPTRVHRLAGGAAAYAELLEAARAAPPSAPWKEVWRQVALGGEALRQRVLASLEGRDPREIAGFVRERQGPSLEDVVRRVAESTGLAPEELLRGKFQRVLARKVALYLARRFTELTLREIGDAFGVDYTTVHMAARRVEALRREDPAVEEFVAGLEGELGAPRAPEPVAPPPAEPAPVPGAKRRGASRDPKPTGQLTLF